MMELALLDQIAQAVDGGGGAKEVFQGSGAPVAAPTDATAPAVYTDLDTGVIYTWNVVSQSWI
jgi:hypothetical protein